MGYLVSGRFGEFWGSVASMRGKHSFESGKAVTNFSVAYDKEERDGQGGKKLKYIRCSAWNNPGNALADYAEQLEQGDIVTVRGTIGKDKDKNGDEIPILVCDTISYQPQPATEEE